MRFDFFDAAAAFCFALYTALTISAMRNAAAERWPLRGHKIPIVRFGTGSMSRTVCSPAPST
ncbi:MAG: hypothetical protein ABUU24_10245, partial [Variovorax sp.]